MGEIYSLVFIRLLHESTDARKTRAEISRTQSSQIQTNRAYCLPILYRSIRAHVKDMAAQNEQYYNYASMPIPRLYREGGQCRWSYGLYFMIAFDPLTLFGCCLGGELSRKLTLEDV